MPIFMNEFNMPVWIAPFHDVPYAGDFHAPDLAQTFAGLEADLGGAVEAGLFDEARQAAFDAGVEKGREIGRKAVHAKLREIEHGLTLAGLRRLLPQAIAISLDFPEASVESIIRTVATAREPGAPSARLADRQGQTPWP